jgi:hypothetical protein
VREDVYALGVRFNAGETDVRAALDAAIRRSDELEAKIVQLTLAEKEEDLARPQPMYGPPVVQRRGFFDWLRGRK